MCKVFKVGIVLFYKRGTIFYSSFLNAVFMSSCQAMSKQNRNRLLLLYLTGFCMHCSRSKSFCCKYRKYLTNPKPTSVSVFRFTISILIRFLGEPKRRETETRRDPTTKNHPGKEKKKNRQSSQPGGSSNTTDNRTSADY